MEAALLPGLDTLSAQVGLSPLLPTGIFVAITIWSLTLKGVGLWYAARNHQKRWFIAMLILNTFGILEIVYLLWFRADKRPGVTPSLFEAPAPGGEHVAGGTPSAA